MAQVVAKRKKKTIHQKDSLGTYFSPTHRLSKNMLLTAVHLLEHYLCVWEGNETENLNHFKSLGFNIWGNKKNSSSAELKSKENRIVKNRFIETAHSPARALIAENNQFIIITFRGSGVQKNKKTSKVQQLKGVLKNAIADARVSLVKRKGFPGRVHIGFYEEYSYIQKPIKEALKKCTNIKNKQIYISGFSLGAAVGTLCLWDFQKNMKSLGLKKKPMGYFFACPSAGDAQFNNSLKKNKSLYLFAHEKDPIPQIPQGLFKNYVTPGEKLFVFGTQKSFDKETCHKKVEHIRIKNLKIRVRGKKYLPRLALIATLLLFKKAVKAVLAAIILNFKDIIRPGAAFHNGYVYQNCLLALANNFDEKIHKRTTLTSSYKKYHELAQKGGVSCRFLEQ